MNEPQSERAVQRLLNRLQVDVKACDSYGERTERDFTNWRDGVQAVQQAVVTAQSQFSCPRKDFHTNFLLARTGKDLTTAQDQTEIASANVQRKNMDFKRAEEDTKIARERHERALAEQKQREEFLQSKAFRMNHRSYHVGCILTVDRSCTNWLGVIRTGRCNCWLRCCTIDNDRIFQERGGSNG